jgi:pseudaminic acid cytidylyltransferase
VKKVAIIPARGGSKRIPRKNIKHFLGKPIIAYSIEVAFNSGLFDEVMVSTDDEEIAEVARRYGAKVPFMRSQTTSDDYATTVEVLMEVLADYRRLENKNFDIGCCIYPTAPLASTDALTQGFTKLINESFDSVFPVLAFSYPIWRGLEIMESGKIQLVWKEYAAARSQDLKSVFHDAGQWYWFRTTALQEHRTLMSANAGAVYLTELEVQDIDSLTDWQIAELKYQVING